MIEKKELRKSLVEDKIESVIESLQYMGEKLPKNFEDFDSRTIRNSIYKETEFAIQNIIDICSIINSDLRLGSPETEDSIFDHLEKHNIFNKEVITLIREMKRFRNVLVHRYGEIKDKQAFETIKENLNDFEKVVKEVEEFLKNN